MTNDLGLIASDGRRCSLFKNKTLYWNFQQPFHTLCHSLTDRRYLTLRIAAFSEHIYANIIYVRLVKCKSASLL
jgi:hypothetical protein